MSNDEFALEKSILPLFRKQCVITIANNLIDPKGFNLKRVPGRSYKIFTPVFPEEKVQLARLLEPVYPVIYFHMLTVRLEALNVIGDEYLFIRAYRVGHTLEMETIAIVVEAQVKGECHVIDEDGHIGGDGKGHWYAVLCPAEAEPELVADLKAEEAKRRKLLPKALFRVNPDYPFESIPKDERYQPANTYEATRLRNGGLLALRGFCPTAPVGTTEV